MVVMDLSFLPGVNAGLNAIAALLLVVVHQLRQANRTGQTRGTGTDDQHVHRHRLLPRWLLENQLIGGKRRLELPGRDLIAHRSQP